MSELREGFREIVEGWTLIDGIEDLTERIERTARWATLNGPLWPDEQATVRLMIEAQIARGMFPDPDHDRVPDEDDRDAEDEGPEFQESGWDEGEDG